jgi:hypothetical protein
VHSPIPLVTASSDDVLAEVLRYGLGFWLHATGPGISWAIVRLVGDDQQLAAIGTGGALREIEACHGAVRLSELHRCAHAAEPAAALAAGDGRTEALGIYLGPQRVHVGDPLLSIKGSAFGRAWRVSSARLGRAALMPTSGVLSGKVRWFRPSVRLAGNRLPLSPRNVPAAQALGHHGATAGLTLSRPPIHPDRLSLLRPGARSHVTEQPLTAPTLMSATLIR